MKYIFVTGAPGSKWSSVVKNIYYSNSVDQSDASSKRTYQEQLHLGAYWDPGMEFGNWFDQLNQHSIEECEHEFDLPFTGTGVRIIKSHVFAHNIDFLRRNWPNCSIVLVQRSTDACLGWWIRCGGFDISYPKYRPYYQDYATITNHIEQQNLCIAQAVLKYSGQQPEHNHDLAQLLNLDLPPKEHQQHYSSSDIKVTVI